MTDISVRRDERVKREGIMCQHQALGGGKVQTPEPSELYYIIIVKPQQGRTLEMRIAASLNLFVSMCATSGVMAGGARGLGPPAEIFSGRRN